MALSPPPELPIPPATVAPALRCRVHAACRGEPEGVLADLAARDRRLAGVGHALGQPVAPATPTQPARIRVQLRPDPSGRASQALPGTHDLQPVAWCGLAHPAIQAAMATLPASPRGTASLEIRTDGTRVVASVHASQPRFRGGLATELRRLALPVDAVAVDGRAVLGDPRLRLTVAGITHELSPETFTQVQLDTNQALVEAVRAEVLGMGAEAVLDLYAGCGNLGLPLAAAGLPLTSIEQAGSASADARRTADAHGLQVDIRTGDAGAFQAGDAFFDVAVLDPPRAGAPGLVARLLLTRPKGIVYVCCNPAVLARDLRPALQGGYRITRLQAFDMFPLTEHVEILAVLQR